MEPDEVIPRSSEANESHLVMVLLVRQQFAGIDSRSRLW
jgi:hypothetical protein